MTTVEVRTLHGQDPDPAWSGVNDYDAFLSAKVTIAKPKGFDVDPIDVHPLLKPHHVAHQPEDAEEQQPEMLVAHSEMQGGWCVYVQSACAEYDVVRGPFQSQDQAHESMGRLLVRSNPPNTGGKRA
jgi:hypothetical protein